MSNSLLLVGQAVAWAQMTQERTEEMGLAAALRSSVVGQDLCELCLIVREESKERSSGTTYQEKVATAKAVGSEVEPGLRVAVDASGYAIFALRDDVAPEGLAREVCGPPPRFEA